MSLVLIFFLPIFVTILSYYYYSISAARPRLTTTAPPTSPACYPIIGNLVGTILNYNRFYDYVTDNYAATCSLTLQGARFLSLSHFIDTVDPKNLSHFLKSNFHNFVKGSRFNDNIRDLLGDGIFNADSDLWSVQRKIASHEFNTKSLRSFISRSANHEIKHRLVPLLSRAADEGRVFDLQGVFLRFMFDSICDVAFGFDPKCLDPEVIVDDDLIGSEFARAFDDASEICIFRLLNPIPAIWKVKRLLNVGSERR
ncbi:Cytochrome P450 94B1-like protein [Drosera capensis]